MNLTKGKKEKIIIVGKTGSGKDYLYRQLREAGFKTAIKYTTRPMRINEVDGVDYHFITNEEFSIIKSKDKFMVYQTLFNHRGGEWNYGILKEDFINGQVFIMTPAEISNLVKCSNGVTTKEGCFIVYLAIPTEIRMERVMIREDMNDSIERRFKSDDEDFKGFTDYDLMMTDPTFTVEEVIDMMF